VSRLSVSIQSPQVGIHQAVSIKGIVRVKTFANCGTHGAKNTFPFVVSHMSKAPVLV
jgi:hypothetical protein